MEDSKILELYWNRLENAISETAAKYGSYCYSIAYHILNISEDAEESVSDTYLAAWNTIPPRRPGVLATYLGKITRHISIDRWRSNHAQKRGGGEMELALEELEACVAGPMNLESHYQRKELRQALRKLMAALPETERNVFLCRYWYLESTAEVAAHFGFSESKVKSMLLRTRNKLRSALEKEGLV